MRTGRNRLVALAMATGGVLLGAPDASADRYWKNNLGSGSWGTASNWSATSAASTDNAGAPGNADVAFVVNADATSRTVTLTQSAVIVALEIANTGTGTDTFSQTGPFNLTADFEQIGVQSNGKGAHNQSAGNNTFGSFFSVGDTASSTGTYSLGGTGSISVTGTGPNQNKGMYVGTSGVGTLNQSAGSVTLANALGLYLGFNSSSTGAYNLSGSGLLNVSGNESIGNAGSGSFNQSGGTNATSGYLYLGVVQNSTGTYTLGAGSLSVPGAYEYLGGNANSNALFVQTGGTNSVGSTLAPSGLSLGNGPGSHGTYTLGGAGSLSIAGVEYLGYGAAAGTLAAGTGSFVQNGGTHTVAGDVYVGYAGQGSYALSAGTETIGTPVANHSLNIANNPGSAGTYSLSGTGSLKVNGAEVVGVSTAGTFNQSGGTNVTTSSLYLWSAGSVYNLGGAGSLTTGLATDIGLGGGATFNQTGGTHTAGALIVGDAAPGAYLLSAGALTVQNSELLGSAAGTFTHTGGTHNVGFDLGIGPQAGGTGTYNLSGAGTLSVGGSLWVGGDSAGPAGTGLLNISGGVATVSGTLNVWDTPGTALNLSGGTLSAGAMKLVNPARLAWTGGTLNLGGSNIDSLINGDFSVGNAGACTLNLNLGSGLLTVAGSEYAGYPSSSSAITQSSGTHTVTQSLRLGSYPGSSASYHLVAGNLVVLAGESVGESGNGMFVQTGGAHILGSSGTNATFSVGNAAGSIGTYALSGSGTLTVNGDEYVGISGIGAFAQDGGTHTAHTLQLGCTGGVGSYSLSGTGNLVVNFAEAVGFGGGGSSTFVQSGGNHIVGNLPGPTYGLSVGYADNGTGTYFLSGGTLTVIGFESEGLSGPSGGLPAANGSFVQTGGTHTVSTDQIVGSSGIGSYALSAGLHVIMGNLFIAQASTSTGTYSLSGSGTLNVDGSAVIGSYATNAAAELNISGGTASVAGSLVIPNSGGAVNLSGGTLNVSFLDTQGDPSHFNWTGGTLNLTGTGLSVDASGPFGSHLNMSGGKTLTTTGALVNNADITLAGGSVGGVSVINNSSVSGYGAIAGVGGFTNSSVVSVSGGTLTLSNTGTNINPATITVAPGAQLFLGGGGLANTGTIDLASATLAGFAVLNNNPGGLIAGNGAISAPLSNNSGATLLVQNGSLNLTQPNTTNAGSIVLAGPAATLVGGQITNNGVVRGDGTVANALTNSAVGEIRAENAKTLTLAAVANSGWIDLQGGTLQFLSPLTNSATGLITGRGTVAAPSGITNNGQIQLSAGTTDVYGPVTGNAGSKIIVSGGATATFYYPLTLNPQSTFQVSTNSTAVFFAAVSGAATFTGPGAKDFEAGASAPADLATGGSTTVQSPASLTTAYLGESSLTAYGPVSLIPNSPASTLATLNLTTTGTLDLSNDTLTLTSTPVSALRSDLFDRQLFSSLADLTHSVGYAPGLLARLTLIGDANLDGVIDTDDYALLDKGARTAGSTWWLGDFNYDGQVTSADYLLIDRSFALEGNPLSAEFLATRESEFGPDYVSQLLASVPEPIRPSAVFYPLGSFLLRRRRRAETRIRPGRSAGAR